MNKRIAIFLGGGQGSGKTTATAFITDQLGDSTWSFEAIKFAEPLYQLSRMVDSFCSRMTGAAPASKNGALMQRLGDVVRDLYGKSALIDDAKDRAIALEREVESGGLVVIFEDVRLEDELKLKDYFKERGYDTLSILFEAPEEIRLARAESPRPNTKHKTEAEIAAFRAYFDHVIDTSGEISAKEEKLREILKGVGIEFSAKALLETFVKDMNDTLEGWETITNHGANFEWHYVPETGKKRLRVREVAPIAKLSPDKQAVRIEETQNVFGVPPFQVEVQKTTEALDGPR